jgi:hypothetical protein
VYGYLVVLLGCLFFGVRGYQDQKVALQSFDFKPVYSSARCLMEGCDPYDSAQIERVYLRHGGDASDVRPFRPYNANYPPSALFLVLPLAMLPFGAAKLIWLGVGIVLFSGAAMCMADLCVGRSALTVQCVLAAFVVTSTMLVMLAQPAMMSISLAVIAVWCFLRGRLAWVGVLALAVSLTFKPHVGGLIWLFFLLASRKGAGVSAPVLLYRRRAVETLIVTLMLMTPGIVLAFHHPASANWPQELHRNLVGIAARGNASDPGPTNIEVQNIADLQSLFSLVQDRPSFYNPAAFAVSVPLLLMWLYLVMRRVRGAGETLLDGDPYWRRDLLALASAAALDFLPVYHRQYDTRLLLLMFPAVALLVAARGWTGRVALGLSVLATMTMSHQFAHLGPELTEKLGRLPRGFGLVFYRPLPLTLLALSCFFLYCLAGVARGNVSSRRSV